MKVVNANVVNLNVNGPKFVKKKKNLFLVLTLIVGLFFVLLGFTYEEHNNVCQTPTIRIKKKRSN